MTAAIRKIVIVGGGTAGWITAARLGALHGNDIQITLIESPNIGILGVGEGTFPSMRKTLREIGISETEFIRECDATFKQAIKFCGWRNGDSNEHYYHLFNTPPDYSRIDLSPYWEKSKHDTDFASSVQYQAAICEARLAPKLITTREYDHVLDYAYHLDANKFAQLLKKHCTKNLNVTLRLNKVISVAQQSDGYITNVTLDNGEKIDGDLFVDCSGFNSLILNKTLGVKYKSQSDYLFADKAVTMRVPYDDHNASIASATITTAQENGWTWDIGLGSRRGIGYVYSSSHSSDDAAEQLLRRYIGAPASKLEAQTIPFHPGYPELFWEKNCVAIGLSGGFIEPLEATAISVIEACAEMLSKQLPACKEVMPIAARRFNEAMDFRWRRIVDFIKLHYCLNQRTDSDFWIDNKRQESIPDSLKEMLEHWRYRPPSPYDFSRVDEPFIWFSYQYVLYGMGFEPDFAHMQHELNQDKLALQLFDLIKQSENKLLNKLPSHRDLINKITEFGMQEI